MLIAFSLLLSTPLTALAQTSSDQNTPAKARQLQLCDCSNNSISSPYIYYIGPGQSFTSLSQFFNSEICCSYVSVVLKADQDLRGGKVFKIQSPQIKKISFTGNGSVKVLLASSIQVLGSLVFWENLKFEFGSGWTAGVFYLSEMGEMNLNNCEIRGLVSRLVDVRQGILRISGLKLEGVVSDWLISGVGCKGSCYLDLKNIVIKGASGDNGIVNSKNAEVNITNVNIEDSKLLEIFLVSRSILSISNVLIKTSTINSFISAVYLESGKFSNHSLSEVNSNSSLITLSYSESADFNDFSIINTQSFNSPVIIIKSTYSVIKNLVLSNVSSSPAVFILNSKLTMQSSSFSNINSTAVQAASSTLSLSACSFILCSGLSGGSLSISESQLTIASSIFSNNSAELFGGALSVQTSLPVSIKSSVFKNNFSRLGGAIYTTSLIDLSGISFQSNQAVQGPDISSPAYQLTVAQSFDSVHPGNLTEGCLSFYLSDLYNQSVVPSGNLVSLSLLNSNKNSSFFWYNYTETNSSFQFCSFQFFSTPNSTVVVEGEAFCLSSICPKINKTFANIKLDPCSSGEVQTPEMNNCLKCPEGFYSMFNNETSCHPCPQNARCSSNKIEPLAGFWHSSVDNSNIYKCINPDSCLANGTCVTGYTGNICAVCEKGYSLGTSNTCKPCPSRSSNIVLLIFIMILYILVIIYIIYRTHEDAYEPKLYHSVLIKILMNYFQLMMLTTILKMRWPDPFYELISIQEEIASNTGKIFSVDCLIQDFEIVSPYFINQLFNFLAPLFIGVVISVVWLVISLFLAKPKRVVKPYITSIVVVFFIIHPGISNNALSIFSCYEIEPKTYWNSNSFDIQCFTGEYASRYYALFMLSILMWTIGMPAVGFYVLWKNRTQLDDPAVKAKYGFLYHGYHIHRFYWEFIIMLRKILIFSVALLLRTSTVSLQLIFVLIILIAALVLNIYYKPFEMYELNRTENYSILLSIICFLSGLMIESEASYTLHVILFTIFSVANLLFLCYFAKRVYQAVGHYLWNTCPHIARNICPNAPRPKIKIREILQKEERRNRNKKQEFEPISGFVDLNKEVIIQLWNMRHYADFYNEVLAARFANEDIEEIEKREQENLDSQSDKNIQEKAISIQESRPFFKRIFSRRKNVQTVQQKILNIRRQSLREERRRLSEEGLDYYE